MSYYDYIQINTKYSSAIKPTNVLFSSETLYSRWGTHPRCPNYAGTLQCYVVFLALYNTNWFAELPGVWRAAKMNLHAENSGGILRNYGHNPYRSDSGWEERNIYCVQLYTTIFLTTIHWTVSKKVQLFLSTPWRHTGGVEVQLH